jgi:hypothetical protein
MPTEQERKINDALEKSARQYQRLNTKQQRFVIAEIDRTRLEMIDVLNEYTGANNTIAKARLNSLLRDLESLEQSIRRYGTSSMETVINESAAASTAAASGAVTSAVGESAAIGVALGGINERSAQYVATRFADDGLQLSDRVWQLAGDTRDELNRVIRSSIIRGDSLSKMTANVRKVYANETWKIERLVKTEGNTAYRVGNSYYAQESNVVKALKINDHAGHPRHHTHKCYEYAHQNPYGWGEGVFKPTETKIFAPHPNCTSWLSYVLADDLPGGGR